MRTLIVALGFAAIAATPAFAQTVQGTTSAAPPPSNTQGTTTVPAGGATTGFGTNVATDANAGTPGNAFAPGGAFGPANANTTVGTPTLVPEGTVSVIGGGTAPQVIGIPSQQSQQVTIAPAPQTPIFDQAARDGRAKEAARRARGEEPRVYGIAPNTDRDLTHQMPDDRIIRY